MAKKAKTTKSEKYEACAGTLRSLTGSEMGMSTNKRWTQEPEPAGSMMKAKSPFAKK